MRAGKTMRRCALIAVLHVGMCVDLARPQLRICAGRRCRKNGSAELIAAARALAHPDAADVRAVGCDGTCPAGAVLCGDTPVHVPSTAQAFHAASAALSAAGAPYNSAGFPHPGLQARSLPPLLMHALSRNNFPDVDAGLHSVWQFATPTLRFVFQGDEEDFIRKAHETARELPTSFYGSAMAGGSWEMEGEMRRVGGEDGWIAVQVMRTIASDGRPRRWQWQLHRQRRPPNLGAWLVESIGSSDRNGDFDIEG